MFNRGGHRSTDTNNPDSTNNNNNADTTTNNRYHFQRRNAIGGGGGQSIHQRLSHNRPDTHNEDSANYSSRPNRGNIYRVQSGGGIQSSQRHGPQRTVNFASSSASSMSSGSRSTSKFTNTNTKWQSVFRDKDKDDDTIMRNPTTSSTASNLNDNQSTQYATRSQNNFNNNNPATRGRINNSSRRLVNNVLSQGRLIQPNEASSSSSASSRPQTRFAAKKTLKIGDTDDSNKKTWLPSQSFCKLSTMSDEEFQLIVTFLKQYFVCYDKDRKELLAAYHPKAIFSLSATTTSESAHRSNSIFEYVKDSRNLLHIHERQKMNLLQLSNLSTVALLDKLPPTEHDLDSLKLDACFSQPEMMTFSVTGIFKEGKKLDERNNPVMRAFRRTFVVIPTGKDQMAIVNEQYLISNISYEQQKAYNSKIASESRQVKIEATTSSSTPLPPQVNENLANLSIGGLTEQAMQEMILLFSQESKLTLVWSKDCLLFANWNYQEAALNFTKHKNEIPKDAFLP